MTFAELVWKTRPGACEEEPPGDGSGRGRVQHGDERGRAARHDAQDPAVALVERIHLLGRLARGDVDLDDGAARLLHLQMDLLLVARADVVAQVREVVHRLAIGLDPEQLAQQLRHRVAADIGILEHEIVARVVPDRLDPRHQAISSKLVKEIALLDGDIAPFTTPAVAQALVSLRPDALVTGCAVAPVALAAPLLVVNVEGREAADEVTASDQAEDGIGTSASATLASGTLASDIVEPTTPWPRCELPSEPEMRRCPRPRVHRSFSDPGGWRNPTGAGRARTGRLGRFLRRAGRRGRSPA